MYWANAVEKAKALENSRPFDFERECNDKRFVKACNEIFLLIAKKHRGIAKHKKLYLHHIKAIIQDLYIAWSCDEEQFFSYERSSNAYKKGSKLHDAGFTKVGFTTVIDYLVDNGFAEGVIGIYDRDTDIGFMSRVRATEKLIDLLEESFNANPTLIVSKKKTNVITIKDEFGEVVTGWIPTPATNKMTKNLFSINRLLRKSKILLAVSDEEIRLLQIKLAKRDKKKEGIKKILKRTKYKKNPPKAIDFSRTQLHRVFNKDSWEVGGRFYGGWWLRVPRECRKYITINDELTVEIDYKAHHIRILYAREGLEYKGDPYLLTPSTTKDERRFLKTALLTILNADSQGAARQALYLELTKGELNDCQGVHPGNFIKIMGDFCDKHLAIKHHFYTGVGRKLQYLDSGIAEAVLLHFTKKGIPVLPVHDSFIISHKYEEELGTVMLDAYLDKIGYPTSVDLKPGHVAELFNEHGASASTSLVSFCHFLSSMPHLKAYYKKYIKLSERLT